MTNIWRFTYFYRLTLPVPRGGGWVEPTPQGFSLIIFEKNKLETPNFAHCDFDNIQIGRCNQILDPPQNVGGEKVKIWETV